MAVIIKGNLGAEFASAKCKALHAKLDNLVRDLAANTPIDTGEASEGWRREGDTIVNDVEHIAQLNQGSSTQAPEFFIEKTLLSHPGVFPSGTIVRFK